MKTKNEKISETLKKHFAEHEHHLKGKPGWKPDDKMKELKRQKSLEFWDKKGRKSDKEKAASNKANVYAYRARKYNAIDKSSDLKLIKKIYENCPDGYHVDHIVALAAGGLHHQDNLQYLEISENCKKGKRSNFDTTKAIDWRTLLNSAQANTV